MDILAIEDREHGDALEFTRVTNQQFVQIWELTKQHCWLQALKVTILAGWPDTKDIKPLCITDYWWYRNKMTVRNGVIFRGNHVIIQKVLWPQMLKRIHVATLEERHVYTKLEML